jgi:pyruvate ferredoxin oxidoreductase delta subunit
VESLERYISEEVKDAKKVASALAAYQQITTSEVKPGVGNQEKPYSFVQPGSAQMREGVSIVAAPLGGPYNQDGGYRPGRSDKLQKFSSRNLRPVVDFSTCTKCTLCWLQCPDESFDVTPDGYYDANMEYCMGCSVCEAVCPVPNCITMVSELAFDNNASQWEAFHKDKAAYKEWVKGKIQNVPATRANGYRYRGQYKEEIPVALAIASKA